MLAKFAVVLMPDQLMVFNALNASIRNSTRALLPSGNDFDSDRSRLLKFGGPHVHARRLEAVAPRLTGPGTRSC